MNKTTHYQLNQWEPTDQVRRTDFNADNAKIDAALAANPYVKLLELTTTTAQSQINLDVSQFDLTKFHKLEIYVAGSISKDTGSVHLRLNGLTGCYSCQAGSGAPSQGETSLLGVNMSTNPSGAAMELYFFGPQIMGASSSTNWSSSYIYLTSRLTGSLRSSVLETKNLHTLNFVGSTSEVLMQPGFHITVFGFKRL